MIKFGKKVSIGGLLVDGMTLPKGLKDVVKMVGFAVKTDEMRRKIDGVNDLVEEKLHQAGVATVDLKKLKEFRRKMGI
jgi:hypothetical protein